MADAIGSLLFPPDPPGNTPISDPMVVKFGDYLATYINANLSRVWSKLAPGEDKAVRKVINTSSRRAWFDDKTLPSLYVFRHRTRATRAGDDLYENLTDLYALWLPPKVNDDQRQLRDPFTGAVAAAIQQAVRLGRHPDWIDRDDPDTEAGTLGSVLVTRAGLSRIPQVREIDYEPASSAVRIKIGDNFIEFDGVLVHIECLEITTFDPALGAVPAAQTTTIKQGLGGVDGDDPAHDFTVVREFD